ncbi:aminopeptidase P family protein [Acinetobacter sp. WZC-1]|uniref:aminopeptidase P family protein n=1 Tax=Acinetobacter sp. WZC-1 TaxID=3459034 RepID=UPI00403DA67C
MNTLTIPEKLQQLRRHMQTARIDAFIVMSADPHMSEYLPEHWKIRQWLTGFSGSVGTIVVTQDFAGLWVDGRYWVQAEQQLRNTGFKLQKLSSDASSTHLAWLGHHLNPHAVIAVNGQTISVQQFELLQQLAEKHQLQIQTGLDFIADLWQDRPALPLQPITLMAEGLNAFSRRQKIAIIRQRLKDRQIDGHFISSLDDIAWLLNSRGSDVDYNPVFLAHLYLNARQIVLFVDAAKMNTALRQKFRQDGIEIQPYEASTQFLSQLSDRTVLIDPAKVSILHQQSIAAQISVQHDINPATLLKSCKAPAEIAHIRNAMISDGVALCHFFHWLETALKNGENISELSIDEKITAFRAQQYGFTGPSFATIAGFNANGALPHYRATRTHYQMIQGDGLLLIDSGGQYVDGTTDITRVVAVGIPSAEQKRDYTLVLKCHIALATTVYPEGLAAPLLDAIARHTLWQQGLDYRHGTGHGVGYALNVHEGPQVLSYYAPITPYSGLREGMIISNEPGLYHEGQYGIRIENLMVNRLKQTEHKNYGDFLEFETLTLCPIHQECIVSDLLNPAEIQWLNAYHQMVRERLSPHLQGEVLQWLMTQTRPLS